MLRKLVILGSIAALFTILAAAPAFGITLNDPDGLGATTVLEIGTAPFSNPAHGPHCGAGDPNTVCVGGVSNPVPGHEAPGIAATSTLGVNVGAWNAVFGPGGMSNDNTPICGIRTVEIAGLDDGTFGQNTCVTN